MSYSTQTIKALKEIDSLIKGAAVHDMARFDELMVQIDDIEVLTKLKKATTKEGGWLFCGADFNALEDRINTLLTRDPNKEAVLIDGFDGHAYRAYYYFKEDMPDVKQLPEDTTETSYRAKIGDTEICFSSNDSIEYLGKIYTGESLYAEITNNRI